MERTAQKKAADFIAAVIEDQRLPIGMKSFARIGVLIEMRSVKVRESMLIGRKMRRHPIENDADSVLMQDIDHVHQILRSSVAASRRKEALDLIAPRSIEQMLHDRHQL